LRFVSRFVLKRIAADQLGEATSLLATCFCNGVLSHAAQQFVVGLFDPSAEMNDQKHYVSKSCNAGGIHMNAP